MDPRPRRDLLKAGAVTVGGAALTGLHQPPTAASGDARVVDRPPTVPGGGHYLPNRPPLAATPFQKRPPGAVTARGWLAGQLDLQLNGMNGRYDEVSDAGVVALLVQDGDEWHEVFNPSTYGTALDQFNRVTFDPVTAQLFRIEARLQPDFSGGVLEWTFA